MYLTVVAYFHGYRHTVRYKPKQVGTYYRFYYPILLMTVPYAFFPEYLSKAARRRGTQSPGTEIHPPGRPARYICIQQGGELKNVCPFIGNRPNSAVQLECRENSTSPQEDRNLPARP